MGNRLRGLVLVMLLFLVGADAAQAQYNRPGSTSGEFLRLGVSARGAAMGDAFVAAVQGAEATYYNPSAMPWLSGDTHLFVNHTEWFAGINHEYVSAVQHFTGIGSFGLSLTGLYTDAMEVTTPEQPDGNGETFYSTNMRLGVSYARWFTDRVTFGGTVSFINMDLYQDFEEQAFAVDIAASYNAGFRGFRFSMMIANLGSEIQYVDEAYPLPVHFSFGAQVYALEMGDQRLLVAGSARKPNDGPPQGEVGAEYSFQDLFFVRGGYKVNYDVEDFTVGSGIRLPVGSIGVRVDYSYSNFAFGGAHRFGLGLSL